MLDFEKKTCRANFIKTFATRSLLRKTKRTASALPIDTRDERERENGDRSPFCAAFIAAPYVGALSAGCRVARISTIIAGPIINPKGERALSIARNCWFPYLGSGTVLLPPLSLVGQEWRAEAPLHRPRWRINDPAIRRARLLPFSLSVYIFACIFV